MPITRKNNRNWMFWLTLFVLFCTAVYALRSVLLPFVAGIVIGYLLDPFASRFERWGMNRTLATFLVLFLVAIIVLPAMALLIGVIDEQLGRFINVVPQYIGSFLRKSNRSSTGCMKGSPTWNRKNPRIHAQQSG